MKNIAALLAFLISFGLHAQEDTPTTPPSETEITTSETTGDTTIVRVGRHRLKLVERVGKDEVILEKPFMDPEDWEFKERFKPGSTDNKSDWTKKHELTHWSGVTLGINGFVGPNNSLDLPTESAKMTLDYSKSYTFSINFPEIKFRLIKDYVGIYTGLGVQFNSYRLRQNTLLTFGDEVIQTTDTTHSYDRNTLQATYLRIPLMLEFNTSEKPMRSFHVAMGVVGGFRIGSTYVQKYKDNGISYKVNTGGIPNLNLFSAEAMVRVGYGPIVAYASYWLTPLFDKSEGPELYPFSVGLGFCF